MKLVSMTCHFDNWTEMGIDKSIFVSPNTLHLTVVMLKLENKESVDAALNILKVYLISSGLRDIVCFLFLF